MLSLTLSLVATLGLSPTQDATADVPLPTLDAATLEAELAALASSHAHVERHLVARTRAGRAVEALTLSAPGAPVDRPALLLVAGLQGAEAFSSSLALHHARALAEGYGSDDAVTALLDAMTVHVLPRANPDAIEAAFGTPRHEGGATGHGVDDDRDGRQGEDPPQDVDGDGLVTWIRYLDDEGEWLPDPTDARALVRADRDEGERGAWTLVREARDQDGDERVGEDGPENAVVDRNFAAGWEEHAQDVGRWPTDEPEVRGLVEFVLARKALTHVVVYGAHDNLVETPKGVADDARPVLRVPPSGPRASDVAHLERIAERYREATGNETEGETPGPGSFARWAVDHRGLMVLCARPWALPAELPEPAEASDQSDGGEAEGESSPEEPSEDPDASEETPAEEGDAPEEEPEPEPSEDAKRLAWIDGHEGEAWRFDAWTSFEHPELGPVEIGGFTPLAHTDPPADAREALAEGHLAWLLTLAEDLPALQVARFERIPLGADLWRVELVLENTGRMPLLTRGASLTRSMRPARVRLRLPEGATLVAGALQRLVSDLGPVDGRFESEWLVQAPVGAAIALDVDTDHAGDLQAIAEVAR